MPRGLTHESAAQAEVSASTPSTGALGSAPPAMFYNRAPALTMLLNHFFFGHRGGMQYRHKGAFLRRRGLGVRVIKRAFSVDLLYSQLAGNEERPRITIGATTIA